MTTENTFADLLRRYVSTYGAKAAVDVIVVALDEQAMNHPGKPQGTIASVNANLLRQAAGKMIAA